VERVAAIMRAFYCWDAELAGLTNQLRAPTMTSSSSELARMRCRLLRRYDDCRRHFIDKVFQTGPDCYYYDYNNYNNYYYY